MLVRTRDLLIAFLRIAGGAGSATISIRQLAQAKAAEPDGCYVLLHPYWVQGWARHLIAHTVLDVASNTYMLLGSDLYVRCRAQRARREARLTSVIGEKGGAPGGGGEKVVAPQISTSSRFPAAAF
jgi:hypothetical protein